MIYWFATYWVFIGCLGCGLAWRLGMLSAQDRGTLLASGVNGSYAMIARKMLREASLRFLSAIFIIFVGLIVFLQHPPSRPITGVGMAFILGLSAVHTIQVSASYFDLTDRDKLVAQEGILRDAHT